MARTTEIDAGVLTQELKNCIMRRTGWETEKVEEFFGRAKNLKNSIYEIICDIEKIIEYGEVADVFSKVSGIPVKGGIEGNIVEVHRRYIVAENNDGGIVCYIWHPLASKNLISGDCFLVPKNVFDHYQIEQRKVTVAAENIKDRFMQVIKEAVRQRATDIHIYPILNRGIYKIVFRILGDLCDIDTLDYEVGRSLATVIINTAKQYTPSLRVDDTRKPQDARIEMSREEAGQDLDVRVSIIWKHDMKSADIVMRLLYKSELAGASPEVLGFSAKHSQALMTVISRNRGLVVVTGPTGSGKSKTVNCLLSLVSRERNVLTVEDPIEYALPYGRQFQTVEWEDIREKKIVSTSFLEFARAFKRHDPDIIFIGELRDSETVDTAMHLAKTGHLVLATLHAARATMVPELLIEDYGVSKEVLADNLLLGVNQLLVKRLCDKCKKKSFIEVLPDWMKALRFVNNGEVNKLLKKNLYFANRTHDNCDCAIYSGRVMLQKGYSGRTIIAEVFEFRPDMFGGDLLAYEFEKSLVGNGTLLTDAVEKALEGKIEIGSLRNLL